MRLTTVILFTIFNILFIKISYCQNEGNIWYFGGNAGVDFNGTAPISLTNGASITPEGSASICDVSGSLLFYTDGMTVWNRNHIAMPNGTGLMGGYSSTQSAIIVRKPGSFSLYYIFTVDEFAGSDGFRYSIVDMSLQNGNGDVTSVKNIPILPLTDEKVVAIKHQNNSDFWIVVHKFDSTNTFHSYLLTSAGFNMSPVVSNVGSILGGVNMLVGGYLKGSPDGNRIASANEWLGDLELFSFNRLSGQLSNPMIFTGIAQYYPRPYGIEFSPNSNVLYLTDFTTGNLYQYNLSAGSNAAINNSRVTIYTVPSSSTGYNGTGGLQLAPNNLIYHAVMYKSYLGVINNPNALGSSCNYIANGIYLGGKTSYFGLPTFYSSIYESSYAFTFFQLCYGDSTVFNVTTTAYDSLLWNFDDSNSGINNISNLSNPLHVFSDTGDFNVLLILYNSGNRDSIYEIVHINSYMKVDLGSDTTLCDGVSLKLCLSIPNATYLWNNNSVDSCVNIINKGNYWVEATTNGCSTSDSINATFVMPPVVNIGNDTTICKGDSLKLDATNINASYYWQDGSTDSVLTVSKKGIYWVKVSNNYCNTIDSISLLIADFSFRNLGNDTIICKGDSIVLNATSANANYLWQNNSVDSILVVTKDGNYSVKITVGHCSTHDTILINESPQPFVFLGSDTSLCNNETLLLDAITNCTDFLWNNNSTFSQLDVYQSGTYYTKVSNICGVSSDTINVIFYDCEVVLKLPNVFTPNGDGFNDYFKPSEINGIENISTIIYNRWGNIVFKSEERGYYWDGNYLGNKCADGVYFWMIYYVDINGVKKSKTGSISLLRNAM